MLENSINKYFGFLESDFGFKKIPEYNYAREIHNDYIKNDLIIKITYEGSFYVELIKSKVPEKDFPEGSKKTIDNNYFKHYNLSQFDSNSGKKIFFKENDTEKDLLYYSEILKQNPEILIGNTFKFSFLYKILKKFGIKK